MSKVVASTPKGSGTHVSHGKAPQPTDKSLVNFEPAKREQDQADSWREAPQGDSRRQKSKGQNTNEGRHYCGNPHAPSPSPDPQGADPWRAS